MSLRDFKKYLVINLLNMKRLCTWIMWRVYVHEQKTYISHATLLEKLAKDSIKQNIGFKNYEIFVVTMRCLNYWVFSWRQMIKVILLSSQGVFIHIIVYASLKSFQYFKNIMIFSIINVIRCVLWKLCNCRRKRYILLYIQYIFVF